MMNIVDMVINRYRSGDVKDRLSQYRILNIARSTCFYSVTKFAKNLRTKVIRKSV